MTPFSPPSATAGGGVHPLGAADLGIVRTASQLAGSHPDGAVQWLRRQPAVAEVGLGRDGATVDIHFRDGGRLVILPPQASSQRMGVVPPLLYPRLQSPPGASAGRAVVLEPFADELHLGSAAGQTEKGILQRAGFQVDVLVNDQVTVPAMEGLAAYSVVFLETHSGLLPDGDAIVATGEENNGPYSNLFKEGSLTQATVAGQDHPHLYNAITAQFVTQHMGVFPNSSLMVIGGCDLLNAPRFWQALRQQNVAAMISWDHQVYSAVSEVATSFVLDRMASGASVDTAVSAAVNQGLGVSLTPEGAVRLGYLGDGDDTLPRAFAGATATPPATATLTATPVLPDTPVPTATPVPVKKLRFKLARLQWPVVRAGTNNILSLQANQGGHIAVRVVVGWPNGQGSAFAGSTHGKGKFTLTIPVPTTVLAAERSGAAAVGIQLQKGSRHVRRVLTFTVVK